jgi:hypothetical protein
VNKKAIIITDGTESIQSIAKAISDLLNDYKVKIIPAEKFAGNDLLPANPFFIGCENPNPASFTYLEEMLSHINLASRKCGIFSTNEQTFEYLKNIINDSEADLYDPLLIINTEDINSKTGEWIGKLI